MCCIKYDVKEEGLRYNEGKARYDLVHPYAHEQMVKVLTKGSEKYAERNWEKGMSWSKVISSLERHLSAIKNGEDYDKETGLLHSAHVACNAHFLTAYYKIAPQHDDRPKSWSDNLKIGLDIDGVLADFSNAAMNFAKSNKQCNYWNMPDIIDNFGKYKEDKNFWMHLDQIDTIPFEPHCYITSRPISSEWSQEWLDNNLFPRATVYTVGLDQSKVKVAKESGIDVFVDDRYENFVELNNAGILTYLRTQPWNKRYDVGHLRINELSELPFLN